MNTRISVKFNDCKNPDRVSRLMNECAKTNEHEDERVCVIERVCISMNGRGQRICVDERLYITNEYSCRTKSRKGKRKFSNYLQANIWKRTYTKTNNHASPSEYTYRMNGRRQTSMYK